jgi:hypothetical protein
VTKPDRIDRLIDRLPGVARRASRWLRRPQARWARVPAGLLLIVGGLLFVLPLLGAWMLPLGLILLADDIPLLRRARERMLDMVERYRPHWFTAPAANTDRLVGRAGRETGRADAKEGRHWTG